LGFYNYTVVLTYLGLFSGVLGIFNAINGNATSAIICLMLSGLFDMFDGRVARTRSRTEKEQRFGIQIDSLSDLVCFGVLPAVIGYGIGLKSFKYYPILALFILAALIRLAYFNVMEEERQKTTTEVRKYYEGLPVTTDAMLIPLLFCFKGFLKDYFHIAYAAALVIIAFLFVSKVKIKKPGFRSLLLLAIIGAFEVIAVIVIALSENAR